MNKNVHLSVLFKLFLFEFISLPYDCTFISDLTNNVIEYLKQSGKNAHILK